MFDESQGLIRTGFTFLEVLIGPVRKLVNPGAFEWPQLIDGWIAAILPILAHSIRPGVFNAVVTALSAVAWYSIGRFGCIVIYFGTQFLRTYATNG